MYLTFIKKEDKPRVTQREYSLNDVFNGVVYNEERELDNLSINTSDYTTKTVITAKNPSSFDRDALGDIITELIALTEPHDENTIHEEYETFYIPKKSGGLREINAPKEQLMNDLREMKNIFQNKLKVLYHNAAYAYAPKRSIVNALKVHQKNNSRWYLKLDIQHFFPSCSQEFVVRTLRHIYPFSNMTEALINQFIWICFRNDELPQGTPMSPMLTNLIMIPFDYAMQNYAYENNLVYTRYADDILISGYNSWNWKETVQGIEQIFQTLQMPFHIKTEKTRYGSSAGRNWNLGLMVNKDNKITVGYRNKKRYKAMLNNLMTAEASANFWDTGELQHFQGITAYYLSVEPTYFNALIKKYETMYNITLKEIYKRAL